jgi:hypothetical protein
MIWYMIWYDMMWYDVMWYEMVVLLSLKVKDELRKWNGGS